MSVDVVVVVDALVFDVVVEEEDEGSSCVAQ